MQRIKHIIILIALVLFFYNTISAQIKISIDKIEHINCSRYYDGTSNNYVGYITISGGTPPYQYQIASGKSGETYDSLVSKGLIVGTDTITVMDKLGVIVSKPFEIKELPIMTTLITSKNLNCYGDKSGSAKVHITNGGSGGYRYFWSNGVTNSTVSNLSSGKYYVTVVDTVCIAFDSIIVTQPKKLTLNTIPQDVLCHGDTSGYITVSCSGGTTKNNYYEYLFKATDTLPRGFEGTGYFKGLKIGYYPITVNDNNLCKDSAVVAIREPKEPLQVDSLYKNVKCQYGNDGFIKLYPKGGTKPYYYDWNNDTLPDVVELTNLTVGTYEVDVYDANKCYYPKIRFDIIEPTMNIKFINDTNEVFYGDTITYNPLVHTTEYIYDGESIDEDFDYEWGPNTEFLTNISNCPDCPLPTALPVEDISYIVTIENDSGCVASDTVFLKVDPGKRVFIPSAFTPNNDGINDRFVVRSLGVKEMTMKIYNRWGNCVFATNNFEEGWNGIFDNKLFRSNTKARMDAFVYTVYILFHDGTNTNRTGTVTVIR